MHERKRLWEFRWQLTFKHRMPGDVFLGVEQDKYVEVKWSQRCLAGNVLSLLRRASGGAMYHSYGDDPKATKGEQERPAVVFPLSLVDQLIITPAGETAPRLSDPSFPKFGITKSNDRKTFRRTISELELVSGPTYTFGFWSVSPFIDGVGWRAPARGLLPEVRFRDIGIFPPCFFVMYSLKPQKVHEKTESRHLDSRKVYAMRLAYWSTLQPPASSRADQLLRHAEPTHVSTERRSRRGHACGCF